MGYILPIQQHEYTDYQKRMLIRQRKDSSVERTYKALLDVKYEELKRQEEIINQPFEQKEHKRELKSSLTNMDEVFTEITGIGKYINERI